MHNELTGVCIIVHFLTAECNEIVSKAVQTMITVNMKADSEEKIVLVMPCSPVQWHYHY